MRRPLVLAALICMLAVVVWLGTDRSASAYTPNPCSPLGPCSCDVLNGWPCDTVGETHVCTTSDGFASSCTCRQAGGKKNWVCRT